MTDAIMAVLEWINGMILGVAGDSIKLTGSLKDFLPSVYVYVDSVMRNVAMPIAYVVLALFFVMELYRASVRNEGMGGGSANLGAEIVFKVLFRMVICKVAVDSTPLILNAIYSATTYITQGVSNLLSGGGIEGGGIDVAALEPAIEALSFWSGLICLILCFLVFLIAIIAVVFASVIISARFIEIYVYFAISPIPIATFPNEEMSQIGKNFLKSFAAVAIQGTLIFLVLSFFPALFNGVFLGQTSGGSIFSALMGVLGYSIVIILAIFAAGKWAKSICNAM